jgi:transposase InsO family protein
MDEPLGRTMLKLMGLPYIIKYVRGESNVVADWLSRSTTSAREGKATTTKGASLVEKSTADRAGAASTGDAAAAVESNAIAIAASARNWLTEQQEDNELAEVVAAVIDANKTPPAKYRRVFNGLQVRNGLLYLIEGRFKRLVMPEKARSEEIKVAHELYGHQAADKLHERLKKKFYWPRMNETIAQTVAACDTCRRSKDAGVLRPEMGHLSANRPFDLISMDVIGPLTTTASGCRFIIVAIDYFSKWVEAKAVKSFNAETTAKFIIERIFLRFGIPKSIISDQGPNFEADLTKQLCDQFRVRKLRSTAYHPQGNGAVERENRSIKEMLRAYEANDNKKWDEYIPYVTFARNTTVHASTGESPYRILFGVDEPTPDLQLAMNETTEPLIRDVERIRQEVRQKMKESQQREKNGSAVAKLEPGQFVYLKVDPEPGGLHAKFDGPFRVNRIMSEQTVELELDDWTYRIVNMGKLKPAHRAP